jgi:ribosomal protein S18 acetylase RimI-like enzyme
MFNISNISFQCRAATEKERVFVAQNLLAHTEKEIGRRVMHESYALMAYDGQRLIGAVIGKIYSNWMHLDLVWVDESYRGNSVGSRLLDTSYQTATAAGLHGIEVWTQSWQAPDFYRKLGYENFAVFDDFIEGYKRYILRRYTKHSNRSA